MKIAFVATATENIAIEYLSSFLKSNGHQVEMVFDPQIFASEAISFSGIAKLFNIQKELVRQILDLQPDVISFSVFSFNYRSALGLARELKKKVPHIPILFGGIHPTSVPERVIEEDAVDVVCVGEGEYALLELLDSLKRGEKKYDIKNLWFKKDGSVIKNPLRPLIENLDELPFPDKKLFNDIYPGFLKDYYALSSRGCPFNCTFCANHVLHKVYKGLGPTIRRRSPENMIEELKWAKRKFDIKKITFVDDIFVQDIEWLEKFTKLYKREVKLPYVVLTHPSLVSRRATKLLRGSGCYFLSLGVQSASEKTRRETLKRFDSNDQIKLACDSCRSDGLNFSIDHIFNIPEESTSEYAEALSFYNELRPSVINAFWLQYFPKTEIIDKAREAGIIKEEEIENIEEGKTSTSVVVGLGGKDDFSPELVYTNFQFWFMMLPMLPKKVMAKIIDKKIYLKKFNPPMIFNVAIKFVNNVVRGRGNVYIGIVTSTIYFMKYCLKLKIKYRNG
jgi:anaerobic magnesium-protoporphyrin IX monomethyl ester cyclase